MIHNRYMVTFNKQVCMDVFVAELFLEIVELFHTLIDIYNVPRIKFVPQSRAT